MHLSHTVLMLCVANAAATFSFLHVNKEGISTNQCASRKGDGGVCYDPASNMSFHHQPWCMGTGEYNPCQEVLRTKCPQLNLTTEDDQGVAGPTLVIVRDIDPKTGKQYPFNDPKATWYQHTISGVGVDGYYWDEQSDGGKQAYGWLAGVVPANVYADALCVNSTTGGSTGTCPIVVGMEILWQCQANNPDCEPNKYYEGNVIDPGVDPITFVVKPKNPAIPYQPFVKLANIRPLCFARQEDYKAAVLSTTHFLDKKHPQLTDYVEEVAPVACTPFCQLSVTKSGYNCPTSVSLGQDVFVSTTSDVTSPKFNQYYEGKITAIFYTKASPDVLSYQVTTDVGDNKTSYFVADDWGPTAGGAGPFIIPQQGATDLTATSFGHWTIAKNSKTSTSSVNVYSGGVIKNIVSCSAPPGTAGCNYHVYGCGADDLKEFVTVDTLHSMCWPEAGW